MNPVEPIYTVELFPELSAALLDLLKKLPPPAWQVETACSPWSVKDVAAHLFGGNIGRLSFGRDRLALPGQCINRLDYWLTPICRRSLAR